MSGTRILTLILCVAALGLAGCSSTGDTRYRRAQAAPPLEVPPDLVHPSEDNTYAVPQIGAMLNKEVQIDATSVRLERDGVRRLVVKGDRGLLWRRAHEFWTDLGVKLKWEDVALGIMETDWISDADSACARDKFRLRIEPAAETGVAHLYLSQRGLNAEDAAFDERSRKSVCSDPELEVEMLGRFLKFLGTPPEKAAAVTAEAAQVVAPATLYADTDEPHLLLDEPLSGAWPRVGLALDREGYEMVVRDREKGLYTIRMAPGFGDRAMLFGGGQAKNYTLRLEAVGDRTRVVVTADDGSVERSPAAAEILTRLNAQLK